MDSRGDNPDRWFDQLNRLLRAVDRQAEGWIDRGSEDPQEDVARLEEQTGLLARLLDEFEAAERPTPTTRTQGCDLNQVVQQTGDRWLAEQEVPMVLRSRLAEASPQLDCDAKQLEQAIGRALKLVSEHAGAGGELRIVVENDEVGARIVLQADGRGCSSIQERSATLRQFVRDLGGSVQVAADAQGRMTLTMAFPLRLAVDD